MPGSKCRRPPLGRASLLKFAPPLAVLAGLFLVGCLRGPVPTNAFAQFYDQPAAEELPGQLVIYFLDTGQSDAIYVRAPSGQVMIIDTGDVETPGRVMSFLAERKKVTRIEVLVLSHPHADHIGDALAILNGLEVGAFCQSGYLHTTPAYQSILERVLELSKSGRSIYLEARAGDTLDLGPEVKVSVLHPTGVLGAEANEASLVIKVVFGSFSVLFTGDIGEASERALVERGADLGATVLKVAHHGSAGSSEIGFLAAVQPRVAVIEVGAGNGYGHPSPFTLRRLQAIGARVLRTDEDGTIMIHSDGREWWVLTAAGE